MQQRQNQDAGKKEQRYAQEWAKKKQATGQVATQ
jgi:hypothetical protein